MSTNPRKMRRMPTRQSVPSVPSLTPARVKASLTADQYKLYKLIWERFIASQMADALLDTVSVDIEADNCIFKATGSTVKFEGFTVLYDEAKNEKGENKNLPELEKGMEIKVKSLEGNQHFTQAPPRYTEATLIKALRKTASAVRVPMRLPLPPLPPTSTWNGRASS